jgi:S-formylglutathione hydrolase FrmB
VTRRRLVAAALACVALAAPSTAAAQLEVVDRRPLGPRLTEYTLRTDALAQDTKVRVLLPDGYDPAAGRRYPVLYLLHGCCDDFRSWSDKGAVEAITAGQPLVVVMPDGGRAGFYSDWFNNGAFGPPRWETYHVDRLIPWVERSFRVLGAREGRAIAGLSMGGFGTMSYAGRHPDRFVAAASFSGALDTLDPSGQAVEAIALQEGAPPGSIWGPRATEEVRWRAHNPVDLAENLRPLRLTVRTGNGLPGGPYGGGPDPLEIGVHRMSTSFHERLAELDIPHVWDDYGPGAHQWPYWQRALAQTLPGVMAAFAAPPPAPARVTHTAAEPRYEVYGWRIAFAREDLEFTRLEEARAAGFALAGTGSALVTTPPRYRPRRAYRVRVEGAGARRVRADAAGRLRIRVPLGSRRTSRTVAIRRR